MRIGENWQVIVCRDVIDHASTIVLLPIYKANAYSFIFIGLFIDQQANEWLLLLMHKKT